MRLERLGCFDTLAKAAVPALYSIGQTGLFPAVSCMLPQW